MLKGIKDNLVFAKEHNLNALFRTSIDRIEFEYNDLIVAYGWQDIQIKQVLWEINEIFGDKSNKDKMIRPIGEINEGSIHTMNEYKNKLMEEIKREKNIVVYGAGNFGKKFVEFLDKNGGIEHVDSIAITSMVSSGGNLCGKKIKCIDEIINQDVPIYIATAGMTQKKIGDELVTRGFQKINYLNTVFLESL